MYIQISFYSSDAPLQNKWHLKYREIPLLWNRMWKGNDPSSSLCKKLETVPKCWFPTVWKFWVCDPIAATTGWVLLSTSVSHCCCSLSAKKVQWKCPLTSEDMEHLRDGWVVQNVLSGPDMSFVLWHRTILVYTGRRSERKWTTWKQWSK